MVRRVAFGAVLAAIVSVLTGCPTVPPSGYRPVVINSIEATPSPAHPGDTVTINLDITDDQIVSGAVVRRLYSPTGAEFFSANDYCSAAVIPLEGPQHATVAVTCQVPTYASNGAWRVEIAVADVLPNTVPTVQPLITKIPFDVEGGSDDRTPPKLVSYSLDTPVVHQETTFNLSMRFHDDTLPITLGQRPSTNIGFGKLFAPSTIRCGLLTYTPVSATDADFTYRCVPYSYETPGRSEAGLFTGINDVRDALWNTGQFTISIDVQPGP